MIINVPTFESLNDVALRLYFTAWSDLIRIKPDFESVYPSDAEVGDWKDEWEEYLGACQLELQSACAMVQQSSELALKARICRISPYLLILRNDTKFTTAPRDIEFSEFKTLDAVELPGAVNYLCPDTLSADFIRVYNEIRSLRNRITHLGDSGRAFTPDELLHLMIQQYCELWNDRRWLFDRTEFAARTRSAVLCDIKYSSSLAVMEEWPIVRALLRKSEYKRLFRVAKNKRLYVCHECFDDANTGYGGLVAESCGTAYLIDSSDEIECLMCGARVAVTRKPCLHCKGNVVRATGEDEGRCHTCGRHPDDDD